MTFRALVLEALDAGDVAPDSAAGRIALDRSADVGMAVSRADYFAAVYRKKHFPKPRDPQLAAVNLVLLAVAEAARGVRVTGG